MALHLGTKRMSLLGLSGLLLRGAIVNRTYGTHKNLYVYLFLLTKIGPIYYGPPLRTAGCPKMVDP